MILVREHISQQVELGRMRKGSVARWWAGGRFALGFLGFGFRFCGRWLGSGAFGGKRYAVNGNVTALGI